MSRFFSHLNNKRLRMNKILSEIIPMEELTPEQIRKHKNAKMCSIVTRNFTTIMKPKCLQGRPITITWMVHTQAPRASDAI